MKKSKTKPKVMTKSKATPKATKAKAKAKAKAKPKAKAKAKPKAKATQKATGATGALAISIAALCTEYATNEQAADARYSGRRLRVNGRVLFAGESKGGKPIVMFHPPADVRITVSAVFSDADRKTVSGTLSRITTEVFVVGTCQPKAFGDILELRACELDYEATVEAQNAGLSDFMNTMREEASPMEAQRDGPSTLDEQRLTSSPRYDVATLEREFGLVVPERARKFIESELAKHKGSKLSKSLGRANEYRWVVFGAEDMFDTDFFNPTFRPGKLPLAVLRSADATLNEPVMLDCMTGAIEYGIGNKLFPDDDPTIRPIANDLDGFLAMLTA